MSGLQATWAGRQEFPASLPGEAAELVSTYRPLLEKAALEWSKEYFLAHRGQHRAQQEGSRLFHNISLEPGWLARYDAGHHRHRAL